MRWWMIFEYMNIPFWVKLYTPSPTSIPPQFETYPNGCQSLCIDFGFNLGTGPPLKCKKAQNVKQKQAIVSI